MKLHILGSLQALYAEQGTLAAGVELVGDFLARIYVLVDHPEMGRVVPEFGSPALRQLIRPPVGVAYRLDPGEGGVGVWRSERRLYAPQVREAIEPRPAWGRICPCMLSGESLFRAQEFPVAVPVGGSARADKFLMTDENATLTVGCWAPSSLQIPCFAGNLPRRRVRP